MSTKEILLNQNNDQYIRRSSVQTFIQEIEEKVEDWINKNILGISKPQFTIKGLLPLVEKDVWLVNILCYYQKQELGFIIEAYINDITKELSLSTNHSIEDICNKLVKILEQERSNNVLYAKTKSGKSQQEIKALRQEFKRKQEEKKQGEQTQLEFTAPKYDEEYSEAMEKLEELYR